MSYSILYTLLQQHEEAADYYERAEKLVREEDSLQGLLAQLARYHRHLGGEVRQFLEDGPPIPIPNQSRKSSTPGIKEHWPQIKAALETNNRVTVIDLCQESEIALSEFYILSLGASEQIAPGILDLLEKQHRRVSDVAHRMAYFRSVPHDRREELDLS